MKDWILGVVKFILAVLLAPALVAVTQTFYRELHTLQTLEFTLYQGIIVYTLVHLFVFVPEGIYQVGQKIFSDVFRFSTGLSSSVPLAVPLYPTLLLIIYYITTTIFKVRGVDGYVVFAVGVTLAMHLILSAKELYDSDDALLKPHYLLCFGLTYFFSLAVVAALLSLNFPQFSFLPWVKMSWAEGRHIYLALVNQLFL